MLFIDPDVAALPKDAEGRSITLGAKVVVFACTAPPGMEHPGFTGRVVKLCRYETGKDFIHVMKDAGGLNSESVESPGECRVVE